jgi:hypothetical protein
MAAQLDLGPKTSVGHLDPYLGRCEADLFRRMASAVNGFITELILPSQLALASHQQLQVRLYSPAKSLVMAKW